MRLKSAVRMAETVMCRLLVHAGCNRRPGTVCTVVNRGRSCGAPDVPAYPSHSGGGMIVGSGVDPGSGRPLPSRRLIARTAMSWSHTIWHDSLTPDSPL